MMKTLLHDDVEKLYSSPFPATRQGALYNAFSYPTKISPESIALFVAVHTEPGDVVLDTFAGSGTTGLACRLCDRPTMDMLRMATQLGLSPKWGPREAVLVELGVLGSFISETLCSDVDPVEFLAAAKKLVRDVGSRCAYLYQTKDPDGNEGTIRHAIWSDVLKCPQCSHETTLWQAALRFAPLRMLETFACQQCGTTGRMEAIPRATESVVDPLLGKEIVRKKRLLAQIAGSTGKRKWIRDATAADNDDYSSIAKVPLPRYAPLHRIVWGELHRAGYHTGITHLHHFYTHRNYLVMCELWRAIEAVSPQLQAPLRLLVLSYNAAHATLMTRVVFKQGQRNLVLTGAQSGVLYVSGMPVEKNILVGLERKATTIAQAFALTRGSRSRVTVLNTTSTELSLADASVDYVFSDPPFGGFIPYAEVNQINEAWLGRLTERENEVIISPSQQKSLETYEDLMTSVFREVARVLKPIGKATIVFHSARASVWQALVRAFSSAGFAVEASSVLDKIQESFKQVVADVSVKGDPLILLAKTPEHEQFKRDSLSVAKEVLASGATKNVLSSKSVRQLFSVYVSQCLSLGVSVEIDAAHFHELASETLALQTP